MADAVNVCFVKPVPSLVVFHTFLFFCQTRNRSALKGQTERNFIVLIKSAQSNGHGAETLKKFESEAIQEEALPRSDVVLLYLFAQIEPILKFCTFFFYMSFSKRAYTRGGGGVFIMHLALVSQLHHLQQQKNELNTLN